jgi:hypothetical protein
VSDVTAIRSGESGVPAARRVEPCHGSRQGVADGRQCRIWLNEARREIDRLRGSLARPPVPRCDTVQIGPAWPDTDTCPEVSRSDSARSIYAPPPLGDVSNFQPRELPPPPQVPHVANYFHVTNLGSLLDVLA